MALRKVDPQGRGEIRSDAMLRAVLDSASQAIIGIGPDGHILMCNLRTSSMFGYTPAELYGTAIEALLPESMREAHVAHRDRYFASPRVRPMGAGYELSARHKNGTEFPVEISLSFTKAEVGMMAIAFVTDISQRKRLEEQLVQSQKMEAVGRLAGGVAHDFNNLLTIILGYNGQVLENLSPFDALRGASEEVQQAAERASALTKQLLAFSRRQPMQPKIINLNQVLTGVQGMLRRLIPESVEMVVLPHPNLRNTKADQTQLEQIIMNLVVNARDAMPSGGRLAIETNNVHLDESYARTHLGVHTGDYVMLAVSDTGVGMDAETRRRIFEPFFTTKPSDKGTGMGLATVYGIVKQSQGDIWVYSEPGKGATFKVYLPAVKDATQDTRSKNSVAAVPKALTTVLVVEDEPPVRKLICDALRRWGYQVLEAANEPEATRVAQQHKGDIHLLLTDVVMPKSNARNLAEQLVTTRPDMRVLFMSGYTEDTVIHHGIIESGIDFLPKPFSVETLVRKVHEVLGG